MPLSIPRGDAQSIFGIWNPVKKIKYVIASLTVCIELGELKKVGQDGLILSKYIILILGTSTSFSGNRTLLPHSMMKCDLIERSFSLTRLAAVEVSS